ncbi:hypothetical protein STRTUCAR8_09684 [Streptomyces turgidiscabies Car8]|uniref:Uncharacterized protein n=1 Tax=Streptomyces turgidiscabies (strain Car8) TaxID=698760 RepID=L7EYH6_STRT8|nr:hypothetical protein STRTUCAR8_09684 [Streptomyces turgidiscabies Car8]
MRRHALPHGAGTRPRSRPAGGSWRPPSAVLAGSRTAVRPTSQIGRGQGHSLGLCCGRTSLP